MNAIKTTRLHGFIFIYTAAALAFLVLMAMDMVSIGRTVLKAIPVSTLMVLMLRDIRGFARICLAQFMIIMAARAIWIDEVEGNA